jgi:putative DNA primase/helicase
MANGFPDISPLQEILKRKAAAEEIARQESLEAEAETLADYPDGGAQDEPENDGAGAETKANGHAAPGGRPTIKLIAGELHTAATEAENAIIGAGVSIYQRGKTLVRPIRKEVPASRGRTTIAAGLGEQSSHGLIDALCEISKWIRFDARANDWVRCNPSSQVANILLSREGRWAFPPVAGVITTPTLRPDGTILSEEGYDPATRLYHVADPTVRLHPAVHTPSRAAAECALKVLSGLLEEFPFVSMEVDGAQRDVARSVALSALITPVVRGALTVAPLHAFRANTAGTGKSYLVDVASAISTGRPCPAISAAPEEAETEKRIAGLLLSGYPLVNIDNVNGELGGDLLCQAVERPLVRIRRLGGSDIFEIESRATITATGNQLRVVGDMVRRTLICDLDAEQERPELRQFKSDPVATVLADRGRYISAALVIVGAYLAEGQQNKLPALASFQDWSDLVRSALVWLGCADPVLSMEAARENDPQLWELREVLEAWSNSIGVGVGVTLKEVADKVREHKATSVGRDPELLEHPELLDALMTVAGERGEINTRRLGKWLLNREGRIAGGHRIERGSVAHGGAVRWRVAKAPAGG